MTGLECQVRPHHAEKIDYSEMCTFDEELAVKEFIEGSKISDPGERGDQRQSKYACSEEVLQHQLTRGHLLGYREQPAQQAQECEPGSFFLFDCGEETMSQLVKMRGREGAERLLFGLKGVYISHLRADHLL